MKITKVTITGADDAVEHEALEAIQNQFPFVEWGILFSFTKAGTDRYPSPLWVGGLPGTLNVSAHLCGGYARKVIEEDNFGIFSLLPQPSRYQINYNFKASRSEDWAAYSLFEYFKNHPEIAVIFQANKSNENVIERLCEYSDLKNIHFLYDSSGGVGRAIHHIENPFDTYTGYAGGIRPENVESICDQIVEYPYMDEVWIDMESGVRTNNKLDLRKVEYVLSKCEKYIK